MNYIDRVKIEGFWGEKQVDIKFGHSENFLIGVNGSGKTTIINLTAACVEADFYTLDRIEFETVTIFLTSTVNKRTKSRIVVKKEENDKTPFQNILFQIYKGKEKTFEIYLDDLEEDRLFRQRNYERHIQFRNKGIHRKDLQHELEQLFNTSWLSIHRFRTNFRRQEERGHESLVDQKLSQFLDSFTGYLNELNRKSKEETDKFQKYIFLSLLSTQTEAQIYQTLRSINLEKEKESLSEIYSLFKLDKKEYKSKLDNYSESFTDALAKSADEKISFRDAEYLIGMKRIHSVIQEWQQLLHKQDIINESRANFMSVVNGLLQRKELEINERNELLVVTQSGKKFHPRHLSSGEKQLLIIFGETLLQKSQPHIFIADEPELSLHVEWQESLVKSLKILNPLAQMIFATHSPDIVGTYQDSVIRIENCIK
jgi:energy-coupling factor transporter ATP-binding protein EcfA2